MKFTLQCVSVFIIALLMLNHSAFSANLPAENEELMGNDNKPKHLALIAGGPSHSTGTHEHRAGILLFERCLANIDNLEISTHFDGWPSNNAIFDNADAVLMYMDGGDRHHVIQEDRLEFMQQHIDEGIGFGAMHYGVEVPSDNGGEEFMDWIGGHYETYFSVNPIWEPTFDNLPNHPILRGVEPFTASDEWYFSIRFRQDMAGITPLLVTPPTDDTRDGPYVNPEGPYEHIVEAKGQSEVVSWVVERKDGGRGFGFTGGHFHRNWGDDNYRKYVLNSLVWLSGLNVPVNGVTCAVSEADLEENLDH